MTRGRIGSYVKQTLDRDTFNLAASNNFKDVESGLYLEIRYEDLVANGVQGEATRTHYFPCDYESGELPGAFLQELRFLDAIVIAEKREDEILPLEQVLVTYDALSTMDFEHAILTAIIGRVGSPA